jgi:CRP-like cAMP-binding protein
MIMNRPLLSLLARNPLFSGLPHEVLAGIMSESRQLQGKRGQDIFSAGDSADAFFYVIEGSVKLYCINRKGGEAVIHVIAPGETFAEAAIFSSPRKYPAHAQYIADGALLAILRASLSERIAANPDLALHVLGVISSRQRYLVQQIEQLSVKDAPQRIGTFLLRLCRSGKAEEDGHAVVDLPYDKILISRYLNIQPETFSRALRKLQTCGVKADGHKVFIGDTGKLADFCEVDRAAL